VKRGVQVIVSDFAILPSFSTDTNFVASSLFVGWLACLWIKGIVSCLGVQPGANVVIVDQDNAGPGGAHQVCLVVRRFSEFLPDIWASYMDQQSDEQGVSTGWKGLDKFYKVRTIFTVVQSGKQPGVDAVLAMCCSLQHPGEVLQDRQVSGPTGVGLANLDILKTADSWANPTFISF
jgi:hypothetical protein